METDNSKSDVREKEKTHTHYEGGVASSSRGFQDVSHSPIYASRVRSSKSGTQTNDNPCISQATDNDSAQHTAESDAPSSDLSVYNFDAYSNNTSTTKRGRGRPRKDGRIPAQVQHRKMLRGRGRPKRDDVCSSITQPKIFPGRPRVRGKKIRQSFLPTTAHNIRSHPIKLSIDAVADAKDASISGEQVSESFAICSEVSLSNIIEERRSLQKCSLCNLDDSSCLGQGKLKAFRPTPGFTPNKATDEPSYSEEKSMDCEDQTDKLKLSLKKRKSWKSGPERIRLRQKSLTNNTERAYVVQDPNAELENIGFHSPPEIKHVFQTSGETYVHFNCAVWSEGVIRTEDDFVNVEKAVLNGMFQKCARCEKYGATVKCNIFDCDQIYHYPCAILSGLLQVSKNMKAFCSFHLDMVSVNEVKCLLCKFIGNASDLLMCTSCCKHYHGKCLEPCIESKSSIIRAGWQCDDCKTCQTCRQPGDENKMLVCEICDKGYHTFCLRPTIAMIPKSGWKCQSCRICGDCGARTPGSGQSSRWHLNYTVCDSCYQQRNKGVACPLCGKAYRQFSQRKEMRHCYVCRKYIHFECDQRLSTSDNSMDYVCPICANNEDVEDGNSYCTEQISKGKVMETLASPPEIFFSSSRDSFSSDDNSFSSAESDSNFEMSSGKLVSKRRAKTAEFRRRKKNPKAKLKSFTIPGSLCFTNAFNDPKEYKTEDDDPTADNKMVLVSSNDEFVLCQDLCVMCGSFGKGDEGRLIACAQCGQCYHSYCAGIKVTPVVLKKGWRCLDCTVCEGCGQPHDEGRLLLCDECDISFHIYCLDPPLTAVPPGNWKCKWCVICLKCGSRYPGFNCNWQINYTHCGPCASYLICSVCSENYVDNDLIIQCNQCQRWSHGKCDQIEGEEDAEKCVDYGYLCILCRPADDLPPHLLPTLLPPSPEPEPIPEKPSSPQPKIKEPEKDIPIKVKPPTQFYMDGVCLSETGLEHIKALTIDTPKKISRPRKPRQSTFLPGMSSSVPGNFKYQTMTSIGSFESSDCNYQLSQECSAEVKSESETKGDVEEETQSNTIEKLLIAEDSEKKKRPRKIQKLGIGGFVVKPRGRSSLTKETGDQVDISLETNQAPVIDTSQMVGSESSEPTTQEKPKRRRKPKKKTPLDESFPLYLRDAFFGKDLLSICKKATTWDFPSQEDVLIDTVHQSKASCKDGSSTSTPSSSSASSFIDSGIKSQTKTIDSINTCTNNKEITSANQNTPVQVSKNTSSGRENLLSLLNRSSENNSANEADEETPFSAIKIKEEPIMSFDGNSREVPTCVTENAAFPQMDSKDVEDVIEGALRDHTQVCQIRTKDNVGGRTSGFLSDASNSPVNISQSSGSFTIQRTATQIHAQSSPVNRDNIPSLHHQDSNSSWSESESSDQSQMPKSTMKWEADENLGLLSTISPVLYANINCPHLKLEYPNWTDRVKQIAKIWRSLPSEKRQPYLQKARENRATSRTQKTTDVDRSSKETKTQELDQEKQWKQFQALRQLQQQKQQKVLQEQRAQALMKAHGENLDNPVSFAGADDCLKPDVTQTRTSLLVESETSNDLSFDKIYSHNWTTECTAPKSEDISGSQAQIVQGKMDSTVCPPQGRATQFLQVSRVRPPIDSNKISGGDSTSLLRSTADNYQQNQSILSPRCLPPQHNRLPYVQIPPVARQSLLLARPELTRVVTPNVPQKEIYNTPSAQRPQTSDNFFQAPSLNRNQYVPTIEQQSSIMNQFPTELGSTISSSVSDIAGPKSFFAQSSNPLGMSGPMNQTQGSILQPTQIDANSKITNIVASDPFLHQPAVPLSPIGPGIAKCTIPFKDDLYSSMPGTPRPTCIPSHDCIVPQQSYENILKDSPDPNKLMTHHQLRELLQKQQINKPDDLILQIRGKETTQPNQWSKGTYSSTTLQYMSKDDCFRHPFPPSVRARNLSAKDKPDTTEILAASNLKLDLMSPDDSLKDEKNALQGSDNAIQINLPVGHCESQVLPVTPAAETVESERENKDNNYTENEQPNLNEVGTKTDMKEIVKTNQSEDCGHQSDVTLNTDSKSSPGLNRKRKTAGDIVKDLESEPQGHDSIADACNLDVLPGDVGELELDDDELLGLGNDFNILEYADPELDKSLVGEGEKSNILDEHLDLDDKDELGGEEEVEEELKGPSSAASKSLISGDVTNTNKKILNTEDPNIRKSTEKCETTELHDEFLEFEKKESKNLKKITCEDSNDEMNGSPNHVKKESKVSFPSCDLSNVTFCSAEDLNLKTEVPSAKDVQGPTQHSIPFGSPLPGLSSQESSSSFPSQIGPSHYRVTNVTRQNVSSPSSTHFQQPTLVPQPRNSFSLHVGVPFVRPNVSLVPPNIIGSQTHQNRPLLLQEQPLLLEDLVEQEKREQLRQTQEGLISPQGDALLSDIDFERLKDDVFSGPPDDSLGGPGSLLGSHETFLKPVISSSTSSSSTPSHSFGPPPYSLIWQNQEHNMSCSNAPRNQSVLQNVQSRPPLPNVIGPLGLPSGIVLHETPLRAVQPPKTSAVSGNVTVPFNASFVPTPPSPPVTDPHTEQEKQKLLHYETFLVQQQTVLATQQKYMETEVIKLRKIKKALNAKQRQLRKNGSELAENDAVELARISQEQSTLQKQLDQIRKQSRQHTMALQDFRSKQQKRQQQIPQNSIHASISSLQSSPQSSHSPHQMVSGAPQSPMLPSSPLGPSPLHMQHPPSPLLQQSSSASSSTTVQKPSPLIHPHMLPQKVHFQVPKPAEGKASCNPMQIPAVSESCMPLQTDRYLTKEMLDKKCVSQSVTNPSTNLPDKMEHSITGSMDGKQMIEQEANFKQFLDTVDTHAMLPKPEQQKGVKIEMNQVCDVKSESPQEEMDVNASKSVLSKSLSSSVTNTLNFTLRQTGMPTGCLTASDKNIASGNSEVNFVGLSPMNSSDQQSAVDSRLTNSETMGGNSTALANDESEKVNIGLVAINNESITSHTATDTSFMLRSSSNFIIGGNEKKTFNFEIPPTPFSLVGTNEDGHISSRVDIPTLKDESQNLASVNASVAESGSPATKSENFHFIGDNKMLFLSTVKKEIIFDEESCHSGAITLHQSKNIVEGSSDEEIESISKEMAVLEHEQGRQNVLLKQLLQNCPSAETSQKQEPVLNVKQEESSKIDVEDVRSEINRDILEKKNDDLKSKKPSYLDIRRAQLEKEPTPPPGESKPKASKRKRPKRKKLEGKESSPVRKKTRKGSLSKAEDSYGTPLENIMTQLTNLPPLRILEPNIQPNFNILSVFGAGDLNAKGNQLRGTYGSATLPNHSDVYSYFPYGKDHAAPTVALPPSPPYRGFYNQEFPSLSKGKQEISANPKVEATRSFRDSESPDTVVSSSSPESCMFEPLSKWPELIFIDHIDPESDDKKSYSPVIPLIAPIPIRLMPFVETEVADIPDFDKDKENTPKPELKPDVNLLKSKMSLGNITTPLKDSGNVSVTLTLSSAAAEDICGILSRLADLLKIPVPSTYDIVERTTTPPSQKLGLYRKSKTSEMNIHSLLNGKPRFCRHCDIVVLSAGIRKKACDLTCISKEEQEEEDEVIFCSTNCYMQFALTHQSSSALEDKEAAAVVDHPSEKVQSHSFSNLNDENAQSSTHSLETLRIGSPLSKIMADTMENPTDEKVIEVTDVDLIMADDTESIKTEQLDPSYNGEDALSVFADIDIMSSNMKEDMTMANKWKSLKYKFWTSQWATLQIYKPKKEDQVDKITKPFYHTIKPIQMPKDDRRCILCHIVGDTDTDGAARLLNIDVDKWVHLNCALWSAEVYETQNGALMNVETAHKRALMLVCCYCHRNGASLKCFKIRCANIYHFACAMKDRCVFFKDKTLLCPHHTNKYSENELESLAVHRRVYIDRDEHKQVASMIQGDQYVMRIGSLVFLNIGQLLPQQMQAFHTPSCIYPIGYKIIRMYWSMRKLGKRCQYICSINEVDGKPEFNIQVKENDYKDIILKDRTSKGLWQKVLYPIEKMRRQAKTIKIFPDFITGDDLFGLTEPAVLRIVESLPGVDTLQDYNFRYGRSPFLELPLAINPTGCARSEPKLRTHVKRSHTLHTSNSARTSFHSTFGGIEISSPYIKQFVHSKSSQYRKMKTEWRNNVYLARSRIQGLGLYAARDLEKHTMVIEYIGQLIRNEIAERNEAIYDTQNRGIYMFRLDENRVIDATLCGGLARYMNHSCYPNCVAEVVQIDRENKILIIANRRIVRGEELSYDYKFEVEDDQHKIACLCKAPNCRKWMN